MKRKVRPNVVSGGTAINLGDNLYYMRGKTHKQGGIDIGSNPKTGIEVENGEVVQTSPTGLRVFSAQPILNGISPANALLMGGNPNNIFNAQEAWKQVNRVTDDGRKFAPGGKRKIQIGRRTVWDNDKTDKGDMYYDIVKARYISTMDSLKRNGFTYNDAVRLAPMIVQQNILEGGWVLNRNDNNYGGMKVNNGETTLSFNSVEDFYDAYIKMLDSRWGASRGKENNWRNAKNLDDWARILNREDLGLTTKEKYNEYNSKHKDNPVYLYAPEWHNNNRSYREHLRKAEDRVNAYFNWIQEDYKYPKWGDEEKEFLNWYDRYSRSQNLDPNPDAKEHYYDYRAYWKNRTPEQMNDEWKLGNHLPDTYKKPGHPTFSTESIYSTRRTPGGTWKKVGLGPVYDEQFVDSKYTKNLRKYQNVSFKYGGIHIKPSKRGTFTAAAKRHHMGVQEFARTVLNNRARFSAAMVKKANFARNASKWHKKELGGDMTKQYYITRNNIYSLGGNVRRKAPLGTEDIIPIKKIKVNNRDAWDVDGKIVYSEAEAYRLAGQFADARGRINMSETLEPSIVTAERPISSSNSSTTDAIPISKIKVNGRDAWDVDGRIIFNEQEAYRYRSRLADIQGSYDMSEELNPAVVTAERTYRRPSPGTRQNTIGFDSSLAGVSYYGPNRDNGLPEQQTYNPSTPTSQRARLPINTSGRPTKGLGVTPLRPYDGRSIETPTSGTQSSSTGGQRRNPNKPTVSSAPTTPVIPVDYDSIDTQINNENNRVLAQSLNNDILTPITGRQLSSTISTAPQGLAGGTSVRTTPKNPYYSKLNIGLHKVGNYIKNNPELIGLGINLTGNLAASLINRSAIKGMKYVPAPIPISAQKLPTEVTIEPQVSSIRENVAGQERLIADNTADSRVALARRQRVRNQGAQQYQTLFGNKLNTELQLLTADRLNRQGVDAQNVGQYNQWRTGLYDFENRRREMLAENSVAGINNAAEAIAGERGYLARREARQQNLLNMGLIAATSPNAQNVIGSKEFEEFLRKIGYDGNFSLLRKRLNG